MTDAPPFDPPYFFVEKTDQGVRIVETASDGSQKERMTPASDAAWLPADGASTQAAPSRPAPKKAMRPSSGMPAGSTLLAVPFSEKDAAKKLGARWNGDQRSWYVPPGADLAPFKRWRKNE